MNLLLDTLLPADAMVAWGWRVPFLLSCLLVIVGLVVLLVIALWNMPKKEATK